MKFFINLFLLFVSLNVFAQREVYNMNPAWNFKHGENVNSQKVDFDDSSWAVVSLPHTLRVVAADLNDFNKYSRNVGWYRKSINVEKEWLAKKVFLEFQGVMQTTELFVNGEFVGEYAVSGYDSFSFDITKFLKAGTNLISVKVNNKENKNIPPDGITRDFVLFGGIYRDVNLVVTGDVRVPFAWEKADAGVRVTYPKISEANATVKVETGVNNDSNVDRLVSLTTVVKYKKGGVVAKNLSVEKISAKGFFKFVQNLNVENPKLWSPDSPNLYIIETEVGYDDKVVDSVSTQVGLRWVEWDPEKGFFLNGKHLKLIGTNRHQNWPYIGGAISNANHYDEAKQLKSLGINWIRLSHYPHDPDFITAMDEIGLMSLEEGPTWMRRGPAKWMENLGKSWTSMIRRDRNHPSIIIWNACINHERKADTMLIKIGREEDPSRVYGQADIYCPMDFVHGKVSGNNALTLEHTGHTYPTSRGEFLKEIEQAKRHKEMYRTSLDTPGNHGMASWCAYDYNSFYNSKENAARHGIFDLFRLPKLSYWWHKSELREEPIAHIVKNGKEVIVYSNCDKLTLLGGSSKDSLSKIEEKEKAVEGKLKNPPYNFKLENDFDFIKIDGFKNGKKVVSSNWSTPKTPVKLKLSCSRDEIIADGCDIARVEVEVLDENGMVVKSNDIVVSFAIKTGYGQLIGENPIKLIDGKHIILVQAGYEDKDITVVATSPNLESAEIEIDVDDLEGKVIYPVNFKAKEPSKLGYSVKNKQGEVKSSKIVEQFNFNAMKDVAPDTWIESDVVLVGGTTEEVDVKIKGGEYRIYVSPYTDKDGRVGGGDAIFVRVKSSGKSGEKRTATLQVGDKKADFVVITK